MGDDWARIVQWDGSKFDVVSDWYQSDKKFVDPLVKEMSAKYAAEKKNYASHLRRLKTQAPRVRPGHCIAWGRL